MIFYAEFDMLAPGMTESSITNAFVLNCGRFVGLEKSPEQLTSEVTCREGSIIEDLPSADFSRTESS